MPPPTCTFITLDSGLPIISLPPRRQILSLLWLSTPYQRTRFLSLPWPIYSLINKMCTTGRISMALFLLCFTSGIGRTVLVVQGQKTWCVAKPSTDAVTLQENLNYACSQVDCSVLQWGKPCFNPDNLISHASVAMNLYYQSRGRNAWNCHFKNSAIVVLTDPSYGGCQFA